MTDFRSRCLNTRSPRLRKRSNWRLLITAGSTSSIAALAMVATLPGRTPVVGIITEPLLRDLHIDRTSVRDAEPVGDADRVDIQPGLRAAD